MRYRTWIVALVMSGTILGLLARWYAMIFAPSWLHVVRLRVCLANLPDDWRGVRIAHISDIHAGHPRVPTTLLERARTAVTDFQPDLIAITGDFSHDGAYDPESALFNAWPAGAQVFAVLGNHDHRGTSEQIESLRCDLASAGVTVLDNTAVSIPLRGRDAWVVGVDDPFTWRANQEGAFAALADTEDALLYLAHAPSNVGSLPIGRARLMLCGHTHGGQMRLLPSGRIPGIERLRAFLGEPVRNEPPIYHGAHWVRGAVVIISNGLGMSQFPARVRTRPQVILLELDGPQPSDTPCDDVRRYVHDVTAERWISRWLA
jgi:uncharacterized protein